MFRRLDELPAWLQSRKLTALWTLLIFLFGLFVASLIFWAVTGISPMELAAIFVGGGTAGTGTHIYTQGQSDRSPNYGGQYGYPSPPPPAQPATLGPTASGSHVPGGPEIP